MQRTMDNYFYDNTLTYLFIILIVSKHNFRKVKTKVKKKTKSQLLKNDYMIIYI